MAWGNGAPRGFPSDISDLLDPSELPQYQPQWIGAGAWSPLSTNTHQSLTDQEFTGAGDIVFNTIRFDFNSSDEWFFITTPPKNWISEKITFIPHFLVVDSLSTPQTMEWELGLEYMPDGFLPNVTTTWHNASSIKIAGSSTVPQYIIGTESSELSILGSPTDAGALALRMRRGNDAESDPLYFVGLYLNYVV